TRMHARRPHAGAFVKTTIEVANDEFAWHIRGSSQRSHKVISATSALPQVCGAVVSALIADIAEAAQLHVCRAAAVERDGRAAAFIGDDWESCVVLAAHLHARGWRFLGGDYVLIDPSTFTVHATRKSLYATLSIMDELPLLYRRAVEASPWYSTPREIAFYAVDPTLVLPTSAWAEHGQLGAVLIVEGDVAEFPSLERTPSRALSEGISGVDLERAGVAVAEVKLGDYIATCDLLERWLQALLLDQHVPT
ncbi:MAG TPA: hypothetical protein VF741_09085, partial [Candidatus Aquilonibacter sp.]